MNKKANSLEEPAAVSNRSCITSLEVRPVFVSESARYETRGEERFARCTASSPASAQGDPGVDHAHGSHKYPYTCRRSGHETRKSEQALPLRAVLFVQEQLCLELPSKRRISGAPGRNRIGELKQLYVGPFTSIDRHSALTQSTRV